MLPRPQHRLTPSPSTAGIRSDVDNTVMSAWLHVPNDAGLPSTQTKLHQPRTRAGTVVNQEQEVYNGLQQRRRIIDPPATAVDVATTPAVSYKYNEMADLAGTTPTSTRLAVIRISASRTTRAANQER